MRLPAFVRHGAAAAFGSLRVRIRSGPNRGRWWSVASSGRGAVAGTFEARRVDALLRLLRPDDVVWDIGAHKGYVTLAAARAVGPGGRVHAFEPAPVNASYLRRHVQWNDVANVDVLAVAVSDTAGTARFGGRGSSITYRLDQGEDVVTVATVAGLLADGRERPALMKIDVEGSEAAVLRGARDALEGVELVLVAVHSRELYEECRALLERRRFRVYRSAAMRAMMDRLPDGWSADPDLLGIAPGREVDRSDLAFFTGDDCMGER